MAGSRRPSDVRLAALELRFHRFRAEVLRWQLDHIRYHNSHEMYWGVVALMRKHPYRTLGLGIMLGLLADFNDGRAALDLLHQWLVR